MAKRRVMIIDGSVVARRAIANAIAATSDIEVAASAATGRIGLQKLQRVTPDVVLLEVDMPEMDGLQTLAEIRSVYPDLPVIMFSARTGKGAKTTLDALALGANDYVTKPEGTTELVEAQLADELFPKIRGLCKTRSAPLTIDVPPHPLRDESVPRRREVPHILVIGSSTGGPNALVKVIAGLPVPLPVPVLIVQHMPAIFTRKLAERLDNQTSLTVKEAADGDQIHPGHVYVAPGDFHLTVLRSGVHFLTSLNQDAPENSCRPAVDVLFRSVAISYGMRTLAVVLTGMGRDGLEGCRRLYDEGAQILCQDEATSVVWGMPGYVAKANLADDIVPIDDMAGQIGLRLSPTSPLYEESRATRWA